MTFLQIDHIYSYLMVFDHVKKLDLGFSNPNVPIYQYLSHMLIYVAHSFWLLQIVSRLEGQ